MTRHTSEILFEHTGTDNPKRGEIVKAIRHLESRRKVAGEAGMSDRARAEERALREHLAAHDAKLEARRRARDERRQATDIDSVRRELGVELDDKGVRKPPTSSSSSSSRTRTPGGRRKGSSAAGKFVDRAAARALRAPKRDITAAYVGGAELAWQVVWYTLGIVILYLMLTNGQRVSGLMARAGGQLQVLIHPWEHGLAPARTNTAATAASVPAPTPVALGSVPASVSPAPTRHRALPTLPNRQEAIST